MDRFPLVTVCGEQGGDRVANLSTAPVQGRWWTGGGDSGGKNGFQALPASSASSLSFQIYVGERRKAEV